MNKLLIVANITVFIPIPDGESGKSYYDKLTTDELECLIKENGCNVYEICEFEESDVLITDNLQTN